MKYQFMKRFIFVFIAVLSIWISTAGAAYSCGLQFEILPSGLLRNVDRAGHLVLNFPLGDVELSGKIKIPVRLWFTSESTQLEPVMGEGWFVTPIDSCIQQNEENEFTLLDPAGNRVLLHRPSESPNSPNSPNLVEGGGWVGELRRDSTIILHSCNGWSLTYVSGHLSEMRHDEDVMSFQRQSSGIDALVAGRCVVHLAHEESFNYIDINVDKAAYRCNLDHRQQVRSVGNARIVFGLEKSVSAIERINESKEPDDLKFEFATDTNTQPELTVSRGDERLETYVWDAETKRLINDNDWIYQFTGDIEKLGDRASATRVSKNSKGLNDFLVDFPNEGVSMAQHNSGPIEKITRFVSGSSYGKIRKVEEISGKEVHQIVEYSYDEKGMVIGMHSGDSTTRISLEKGIKKVTFYQDMKERWSKYYQHGILKEIRYPDGSSIEILSADETKVLARLKRESSAVEMAVPIGSINLYDQTNLLGIVY